jgi:hypothetical protein
LGAEQLRVRLFTLLGFSLATVAIITYLHLQKLPSMGQALDGFLSGLYFSGMFATGLFGGVWIFSLRASPSRSTILALLTGFNAGLVSWLLIYLFWLLPSSGFIARFAFMVNSILIFCIGVLINRLPIYHDIQNESED